MRHRSLHSAPVLILVALVLTGCGRGARIAAPIQGLEIAPDYGPTLDITNFRGSVTVEVDPRVERPEVIARVLPSERRRLGERLRIKDAELAGKVNVQAESGLDGGRRRLTIVTTPTAEAPDIYVDLTVRIAKTEGVSVRNTGGPVELVRVSGPITVLNGVGGAEGGDVTVRTGSVMTNPVTLTTTRGDVLYQVGPGSTGIFDLATDSGTAQFYVKMGRVAEARPEPSRYRAVLNEGSNPVTLRTGQGFVRVVVLENSDTYGPDLWDGYPTWPKYPKPIGRLGGHHNDEPLFRKREVK
jgi:hypothetical protein